MHSAAKVKAQSAEPLTTSLPTPRHAAETKGKIAARVLVQQGGESAGVAQTATLSSCGRLVFAATKGAVAVHRRADLALLDVVVVRALCCGGASGGAWH